MTWTSQTLATDADLTQYERKMPELSMQFKGASGSTAYDGKRALAKRDVGTRLVRMGIDLDTLTPENIVTLTQTAVYREMALLYFDLADRNDTLSMDKANRYQALYEDSWQDVQLALSLTDTRTATVSSVRTGRA